MLRNFITDADLKEYHPNLVNQLWVGSSTYSLQISEAFQRLYNDLYNVNLDPRLLMTPLDLKLESSSSSHSFPIAASITSTTTGSIVSAVDDTNRFVIDIDSVSGTWTVSLQGSNNETSWQDIADCLTSITIVDEYTKRFTNKYKYYRYVSTLVTGTGKLSYLVYLVDSALDLAIIYKAFEIIFADFSTSKDDRFADLEKKYEKLYNSILDSVRMQYDSDDSGTIEENEETDPRIYFSM